MDAFKAWPGRAESIVISQESYMRCTGGVAPWRRDGDKGPSYYAVCPLCDNPSLAGGAATVNEDDSVELAFELEQNDRGVDLTLQQLGREDRKSVV